MAEKICLNCSYYENVNNAKGRCNWTESDKLKSWKTAACKNFDPTNDYRPEYKNWGEYVNDPNSPDYMRG